MSEPDPHPHTAGKINRHDGHNESTAAWLFDESGKVIFTASHFNNKSLATANANRVEKVWNAMVGVDDPEKFVEAYNKMLTVLKDCQVAIEKSDNWAAGLRDKGGVDSDAIDAAVKMAEEAKKQ